MKKLLLILLILLVNVPAFGAFPDGWTQHQEIQLNPVYFSGTVNNFPIVLTEDYLPKDMLDADGAAPCLNGGGDIRFSLTVAGAAADQLPVCVKSCVTNNDPASATAEIWTEKATIDPDDSDTLSVIIWWGKSGETQPAEDSTYGSQAVFSAFDYVTLDGGATDETSNQNDGSGSGGISGGDSTGVIGNATSFTYTSAQYWTLSDDTDLQYTTSFSLLQLFKLTYDKRASFFSKLDTSTPYNGYTTEIQHTTDKTPAFFPADSRTWVESDTKLVMDEWTFLGVTGTGTSGTFYRNGVADGTFTFEALTATNQAPTIGQGYAGHNSSGIVDMIFLTDTALSQAFIYAMNANYAEDNFSVVIGDNEWHLGSSDLVTGNNDGTSEANAWQGVSEIDWNLIYNGDTIYVHSAGQQEFHDINYPDIDIKVILDYTDSPFVGTTTIDNNDWTTVSGNLRRVEITATDIDYTSKNAPETPSDGEIWFKSAYDPSNDQPFAPDFKGYTWDDTNSEWQCCSFFRRPNMVWVDDVYTHPVITEGSATNTWTGRTVFYDANYAFATSDHWVGNILVAKTKPYQWEQRIISASTTAGVLTVGTVRAYLADNDIESYIIGNHEEIDTEFEWCYESPYLYMNLSDPEAQTVEYSDNGTALLFVNCSGLEVKNYHISRTNDSAITIYKSAVEIDNCTIDETWGGSGDQMGGAIHVYSGDPTANQEDDTADSNHVNIHDNQISNTYNGNGIFTMWVDGADINNNRVTNTGYSGLTTAQSNGIHAIECPNVTLNGNFCYYAEYSGIITWMSPYATINNNHLRYVMNIYNDGGALRCVGHGGWSFSLGSGDHATVNGNRIEYTKAGEQIRGIYVDARMDYVTADSNIFYAMGGLGSDTYRQQALYDSAVSEGGGYDDGEHNCATNNIIYDDYCEVYEHLADNDPITYENGWSGCQDLGFVYDFGSVDANGNVRLQESTYPYASTSKPVVIGPLF